MSDWLDRIWETKLKNCLMFAEPQLITDHLLRWVDENNPNHYNKNHFLALDELTSCDINAALEFQKRRGLHGILLKSRKKLPDEIIYSFELQEEKQLIMALLSDPSKTWKINEEIQIKDGQIEDIQDELMNLCLSLTEDAAERHWVRHTIEEALEAARNNPNYHWLIACENGKAIARAYAFEACGCVQMEDLWVAPWARQRYIGSTILKYILDHFEGLFFLHTEAEDSVKTMYHKLGFEIVDEVYEYSKVWRSLDGSKH